MEHGIQLHQNWPGVEDVGPILSVNQMLVQSGAVMDGAPEEFILTFGHAAPPVVLGDAEEQQLALSALAVVPIKTLVRVSVSPARLRQFAETLSQFCDEIEGRAQS